MRTWLIILLLLIMAAGASAGDDFTGQYKKKNGEINVQLLPDNKLKFWINTVIGMHSCNIGEDGNTVAVFVDSNRAAFTNEQNCVGVLRFEKNKLKVTTKDCDGYCGMHGTYPQSLCHYELENASIFSCSSLNSLGVRFPSDLCGRS